MTTSTDTAGKLYLSTIDVYGDWTKHPAAQVRQFTDGLGSAPGSAMVEWPYGPKVLLPGAQEPVAVDAPDLSSLAGKMARIENEDGVGLWHGRIVSATHKAIGGWPTYTAIADITIADLTDFLNSRRCVSARVESASDGLADLYDWPDVGLNRSENEKTFPNGRGATSLPCRRWQAKPGPLGRL